MAKSTIKRIAEAIDPEEVEDSKVLVLMRHAKAKSTSPTGDHGRPLHRDGRATARLVGQWLTSQGVRPDIAVVSPATRTVQTWEELNRAGVQADDVWADKALYNGEAADLIESVNALPDDAKVVVVVAHLPAVPQLALHLDDHLEHASAHPDEGWPPAAVGVVMHRGSWSEFPGDETALVAFHRP